MNIAIIATEIVPSENNAFTGGLVNNVLRLSEGLSREGHKVIIFTTDVNNYYKGKSYSHKWATIFPVNSSGQYASLKSNLSFLIRIIPIIKKVEKKYPIDLIHVHSAYSLYGIVPTILSFFFNKPFIFTLYSPIHKKPFNDRKGIYQLLSSGYITKLLLKKAGQILCTSQKTKESVEEFGFKTNIQVVPPLVKTTLFNTHLNRQKIRNELGIQENTKVVLYCGSWAKWKGIDILIKSIYNIKKEFTNIILITAWGEPYNWYDERKIQLTDLISKLHLKNNIIEFGIVNDIQRLMSACDIFVAPFLNIDGVADPPLSILEAMSCGKPVIATDIGSIPEIITDHFNGFIINPDNTEELTDALKQLIKNENLMRRMGKNSLNYFINKYSKDMIISNMIDIYAKMINRIG